MISSLFKFAGQVIGEVVHQTGNVLEDIANIPEALMQGYEEELFEKKEEQPQKPTETSKEEGK